MQIYASCPEADTLQAFQMTLSDLTMLRAIDNLPANVFSTQDLKCDATQLNAYIYRMQGAIEKMLSTHVEDPIQLLQDESALRIIEEADQLMTGGKIAVYAVIADLSAQFNNEPDPAKKQVIAQQISLQYSAIDTMNTGHASIIRTKQYLLNLLFP